MRAKDPSATAISFFTPYTIESAKEFNEAKKGLLTPPLCDISVLVTQLLDRNENVSSQHHRPQVAGSRRTRSVRRLQPYACEVGQ
jgi:hypothetical protein